MSKRTCSWICISTLLALLTLNFPVQANAEQPTVKTDDYHFEESIPCNGFTADFDEIITVRRTTFHDKDGNEDRFLEQVTIAGTVTHSLTGQSFQDNAHIITSGDLPEADNDIISRGVFFNINVPGHGVVTLAVGRMIRDEGGGTITFESGQNLSAENEQALTYICEGLERLG